MLMERLLRFLQRRITDRPPYLSCLMVQTDGQTTLPKLFDSQDRQTDKQTALPKLFDGQDRQTDRSHYLNCLMVRTYRQTDHRQTDRPT